MTATTTTVGDALSKLLFSAADMEILTNTAELILFRYKNSAAQHRFYICFLYLSCYLYSQLVILLQRSVTTFLCPSTSARNYLLAHSFCAQYQCMNVVANYNDDSKAVSRCGVSVTPAPFTNVVIYLSEFS